MANVLNRTTTQFIRSVNTPEYPVADWIIDPDLSAVVGFSTKYWTISGDTVGLMTQAERDAVDLAEAEAEKDSIADQLNISGFDKAFAQVMLDQINVLRSAAGMQTATLAQLKNAVRSKL